MASWNVGVPFKSCLFPWGWFSKGLLAGMRSKETAFKMSFKSVKNQINMLESPPFTDDLHWFPHFSHQQCLFTAGSPHKNLILTGHEGGPVRLLPGTTSCQTSQPQTRQFIRKKSTMAEQSAAGTNPLQTLRGSSCWLFRTIFSARFDPEMNRNESLIISQFWELPWMFDVLRVSFAPLRRVAGSECLASNPWTWPLDLPAIRRHHRPRLEHSRASFRGHVSNTKSVPKNIQWMGWRQNLKETMFGTSVFNVLYQQWHGFPVGFPFSQSNEIGVIETQHPVFMEWTTWSKQENGSNFLLIWHPVHHSVYPLSFALPFDGLSIIH